jgi:GNAT superfamily N-acetyltransferase
MDIKKKTLETKAIRISVQEDGQEVGRARLCLIDNDLHDEPYGLVEDIFVEEEYRGKGVGTTLIEMVIREAKAQHCYKLVAQSRYSRERVHQLYEKIGFNDYGKTFRMDLK